MYAKKPILWAIEAGNNLVEEAKCGLTVPLNDVVVIKKFHFEIKRFEKRSTSRIRTKWI